MRVISLKTALDLAVPSIAAKDAASSSMGTGFGIGLFGGSAKPLSFLPALGLLRLGESGLTGTFIGFEEMCTDLLVSAERATRSSCPARTFLCYSSKTRPYSASTTDGSAPQPLPCNRDEALAVVDLVTQDPAKIVRLSAKDSLEDGRVI